MEKTEKQCPVQNKCGGCDYIAAGYEKSLEEKQARLSELLSPFGKVEPILGMYFPYYYRHKVHHVLARDKKGNVFSGSYMKHSRIVVPCEACLIEERGCQKIIASVVKLIKDFKYTVYDEISGYGLLRHILIRKGMKTGEYMVILVATSPILPSKNNFCKALLKLHPEVTTIVLNVNDADTGMVLGERNITLYGPGKISDKLCGLKFVMSPGAFFQVNPMQAEKIYKLAADLADLKAGQTVIDAYCGTGTVGLAAAKKCADVRVIGAELNAEAVKDAIENAKENHIENAAFEAADAGDFMNRMAEKHEHADVVFMDPPRSGSTEVFMDAVMRLAPEKVVYISCDPETLARDLRYFSKMYCAEQIRPVDMFPFTEGVETVVLLSRKKIGSERICAGKP